MKVTVQVGTVTVVVSGLDLTRRQVRALLMDVAGVASAMEADLEPEPEKQALGFAVITERADDPPEEHLFTDDEEWGSRHAPRH